MSDVKTLVIGTVLLIGLVQFLKWAIKRYQLVRLIDKIPGSKAYPFIGTTYMFFGVKRQGIFFCLLKFKKVIMKH